MAAALRHLYQNQTGRAVESGNGGIVDPRLASRRPVVGRFQFLYQSHTVRLFQQKVQGRLQSDPVQQVVLCTDTLRFVQQFRRANVQRQRLTDGELD